MVRHATRVALVVGTLLTAINQGPALIGSSGSASLALRIALAYAVPFCVALYSMRGTTLDLRPGDRSRRGGRYVCRTGGGGLQMTVAIGERLPPCVQCGSEVRWVSRRS